MNGIKLESGHAVQLWALNRIQDTAYRYHLNILSSLVFASKSVNEFHISPLTRKSGQLQNNAGLSGTYFPSPSLLWVSKYTGAQQ